MGVLSERSQSIRVYSMQQNFERDSAEVTGESGESEMSVTVHNLATPRIARMQFDPTNICLAKVCHVTDVPHLRR